MYDRIAITAQDLIANFGRLFSSPYLTRVLAMDMTKKPPEAIDTDRSIVRPGNQKILRSTVDVS